LASHRGADIITVVFGIITTFADETNLRRIYGSAHDYFF
jgi:hypothetical protein